MPQITPPPVKRFTQKQKILALMCRNPEKWFYPYEFMKPDMGALYVGYKAPTRIAEMQHDVPMIFEKKSEDKYMQRKLNIDRINEWYPLLKPELQDVVDQYYRIQKGHSVILWALFGGLVLWIPAIYFTISPNHYWHA